jgi:hypothetical protein
MTSSTRAPYQTWNAQLRIALAVLDDGKARDIGAIFAEAQARGLARPGTKSQTMYASLERYIIHTRALGRRPLIVLDQHRHFRLNQPPDDWPDPLVLPTRPPVSSATELVARLRATGKSDDSEAFEIAVCDAFAALGFVATHIGGRGAPDGTLDAPLGPLAYRAMLECKTWSGAHRPPHEIAEAAKYRDQYHATYSLIVAPMISEYETEIVSELATHAVSAWTVDDIAQLLDAAVDPHELRPALAPGFGSDYLGGVLWERRHGVAKRVAVATELLWRIGWEQQGALIGAADVPHLTEDAAMLLVDQALRAANSRASADRTTIRAAIAELTSSRLGAAVVGDDGAGVVIVRPPLVAPRSTAGRRFTNPRRKR